MSGFTSNADRPEGAVPEYPDANEGASSGPEDPYDTNPGDGSEDTSEDKASVAATSPAPYEPDADPDESDDDDLEG